MYNLSIFVNSRADIHGRLENRVFVNPARHICNMDADEMNTSATIIILNADCIIHIAASSRVYIEDSLPPPPFSCYKTKRLHILRDSLLPSIGCCMPSKGFLLRLQVTAWPENLKESSTRTRSIIPVEKLDDREYRARQILVG